MSSASGDSLRWYCDRIKRRRIAAGVSQSALAREAGCSQSKISRIENGRMPHASMTTIARIEHALSDLACQRWD